MRMHALCERVLVRRHTRAVVRTGRWRTSLRSIRSLALMTSNLDARQQPTKECCSHAQYLQTRAHTHSHPVGLRCRPRQLVDGLPRIIRKDGIHVLCTRVQHFVGSRYQHRTMSPATAPDRSQISAWQSSPAVHMWSGLCGAHASALTDLWCLESSATGTDG